MPDVQRITVDPHRKINVNPNQKINVNKARMFNVNPDRQPIAASKARKGKARA